jgi:recombination protein RecR
MTPEAIKKLAQLLAKLPSLGPRQATRIAFFLAGMPKEEVAELSSALSDVADIKRCINCFSLAAAPSGGEPRPEAGRDNLCDICANPRRDQSLVAIVEKETDLQTVEKTKSFNGRYLVLGELPKDGVLSSEHKRRLERLKNPPAKGGQASQYEEIILALSPTTYGDLNAGLLAQDLRTVAKKITRLGRGIPTGGSIEFADEETLQGALKNRN